jgi:hypothetical protein
VCAPAYLVVSLQLSCGHMCPFGGWDVPLVWCLYVYLSWLWFAPSVVSLYDKFMAQMYVTSLCVPQAGVS